MNIELRKLKMIEQDAVFVRWVGATEDSEELVNEAKSLTWEKEAEHALIEVECGRLAMVSGGKKAISFDVRHDDSGSTLYMRIDGREERVSRLAWHTHPVATGPSDDDLAILEILGQAESIIHEIGGRERNGTRIRPKSRAIPD